MRIAVNTRLLLKDQLEGIGWYTYQTLSRIAAAHPEHEFIFLFDRPFDTQFLFGPNVTGVYAGPPARHPVLWYLWFEITVPRLLRRYKADVFLSPDGMGSLHTSVPQVVVIHDLAFDRFPQHMKPSHLRYLRYATPRLVQKACRVVTVSEFSKEDIAARYGLDPQKIMVSCNGAQDQYRPLSWEAREKAKEKWAGGSEYFVYVGALQPRKNTVNLLRAFVRFKKRQRSDMKLIIAGKPAWKADEINKYREHMVFKEDVIWPGYCSVEDLAQIIGGAYAMVYPSLFEGFGIPILEALQCGVPAIVSDNSSMPEVGGEAVLRCDPTDPQSIADAMQLLFKDEALRNNLIAKAPAQTAKYTWDRGAEVLWQAVEQCLRG